VAQHASNDTRIAGRHEALGLPWMAESRAIASEVMASRFAGSAPVPERRERACYKWRVRPREPPRHPAPVEVRVMKRYTRSQFSDDALHHNAITHAVSERGSTADLLADLAEIDVRRFYVAMAYPSLFAYCMAELKLSADAAYKRIKVARAARRFPVIFDAVADGRLNL